MDEATGPALADLQDERGVQPSAARLDDVRLLATERRLEAELGRGRHADVLAELSELVREHPLRERAHELLMHALCASGRQADALEAYRSARAALGDERGIEPGPALQDLHSRMLNQDPTLFSPGSAGAVASPKAFGPILVAPLDPGALDMLVAAAEPLAGRPEREIIMVATVPHAEELASLSRELEARRERLLERGVAARSAAFTSVTPGADVAPLAAAHDGALRLVDAPEGRLEAPRLLTLLVPFGGASHDWAAVELGAWLALTTGAPLRLAGATDGYGGRDASRLLASASLAVQHALGVPAEPVLVAPDADALVAAADSSIVAVGLTERWRREGLGRSRTALAARASAPTVLVRRGVRPGGLAPRESDTRFTWTLAGA